eukprot:7952779-Alexandrium_andersonii.AAC.1
MCIRDSTRARRRGRPRLLLTRIARAGARPRSCRHRGSGRGGRFAHRARAPRVSPLHLEGT